MRAADFPWLFECVHLPGVHRDGLLTARAVAIGPNHPAPLDRVTKEQAKEMRIGEPAPRLRRRDNLIPNYLCKRILRCIGLCPPYQRRRKKNTRRLWLFHAAILPVKCVMVPSDQELIARTQRGDNAAFGMLWARHTPRVLSLCQRMLATSNADPATDAQDITSETFIQALHALNQFSQQPGRASGFGPWLQEIARRRCLKWLERQQRRADLLSAQPDQLPELSVAQQVEEHDLLERVAQEINALPDTYRVPFRLMLEQFSHREIAESLGISVATVVQRIHRARVRVRPQVQTFLGAAPRLRRMEEALSEIVTPSRIVTVQLPSGGEIQFCVRVDQRLASQASTLPERRRALGRYPRAWKPWLVFAELAYHCGVWDEARLAYQETLTRNPACLPAALGLWEILRSQARGADAIAFFEKALATQPSSALQALHSEAQADYAQAVLVYQLALKEHPQEHLLYHGLSRCLGHLSRYEEQLQVLENLRRIAPEDIYGYDAAYTPYARLGRWEPLQSLLETASQLDPYNPAVLEHLFQVRMNRRYLDEQTLALAERLVALAPDFIGSWSELAWFYAEQGRHDESLAILHHFLLQHPHNAEAHAALAWRYHYYYQNRSTECVTFARSAYALAPAEWYICWTILMAYSSPDVADSEIITVTEEIRSRFPTDRFIHDQLNRLFQIRSLTVK